MGESDLDDLRRRSDELEASLEAFRATMKPEPSALAQMPMGPPLGSWQWFAELLWLVFVIAGGGILGIAWIMFPIIPLGAHKHRPRTPPRLPPDSRP